MNPELNRLAINLQRASFVVAHQASRIVRSMGERTVAGAQAICPVDTGNLKNSIGVDYETGFGSEVGAFTAGPTASYGAYVEYGTARMAPQAYMGPAFDRAVAEGMHAIEILIGREL